MKRWAATLKSNTYALYLASRNPEVPLLAKILIALVVAYALSPIDLIPDFIPVIGYLDDLLILPVGIWLAIKSIPDNIWQQCLQDAAVQSQLLPKNTYAGFVIAAIWIISLIVCLVWIWPWLSALD